MPKILRTVLCCVFLPLTLGCLFLASQRMFAFGYFSTCSQCGKVRNTTEFQLPRIDIAYATIHKKHDSRLSKIVSDNNIIAPHQHQWVFGFGGGNGVRCASGNVYIRENAENLHTCAFIQYLCDIEEKQLACKWVKIVLDRYMSFQVMYLFDDLPTTNISKKDVVDWYHSYFPDDFHDQFVGSSPEHMQPLVCETLFEMNRVFRSRDHED